MVGSLALFSATRDIPGWDSKIVPRLFCELSILIAE